MIYILISYSVFPISRRCAFVSFLSASRLCAIRRPSCILCIRVRAWWIFILMKPDSINSSPIRAKQQGIYDILKASPCLCGAFFICVLWDHKSTHRCPVQSGLLHQSRMLDHGKYKVYILLIKLKIKREYPLITVTYLSSSCTVIERYT